MQTDSPRAEGAGLPAPPSPKEADRYPSWAWFGPALLSGIFLVVLSVLLYVMQQRNDAGIARALEADAATASEAVRDRLLGDRAFLLLLADDLARGAVDEVAFGERVSRYRQDHPEILSVRWLSPDLTVHRHEPSAGGRRPVGARVGRPESARAVALAVEGRRAVWTPPFDPGTGATVFELWVPVYRGGALGGVFGAAFSAEGTLRRSLPVPLLLDYRLTLEDGLGGIVAALPSEARVDPRFSKLVPLDPPGYGLSLLLERHGSRFWEWGIVALAVVCFALALGMGFGMWLLGRSIGERRKVEAALRESNETLTTLLARERMMEERLREATKMEAVGRLAGGIAHDFNNLLTAILGYSDLLMHRLPEGDRARREIAEIRRSGERAAALTRQLLAFGRKQILRPRRIDLASVVLDMEPMLARLAGENVELRVHAHPGDLTVHADRGQIEQAIVELVENARDAMPDGGRLTVALSAEPPGEPPAGAGPAEAATLAGEAGPGAPGGWVLLSVRDTGRGIDESAREHLFEPFFTTKERGKGTGMGLPTVYGIVTQSGGRIGFDSRAGEGTEFRILLPRVEAPAPVPPEVPAAPEGPSAAAPARTVLVAEDESVIRTLVAAILERNGYAVLEARDGVEALDVAQAHPGPIDLLVTDVRMPRMGGKALADRLAALRPGTKVLFMSGYPDDALGAEGILPEEVAFLAKPFSPDAVSRKVAGLLGGKTGDRKGDEP